METVACDSSKTSYTKSGTREGLTVNHCMRKTQCLSHNSDLILKEQLYRLNKAELKIIGKTSHIMMGFYSLLALCRLDAFENVGIDSTLSEIFNAFELSRFISKDIYKFCADYLSLFFGVAYTRKKIKKTICCVNIDKICIKLFSEYLYNIFGFILAHKAVVNMNADELFAYSLDEQSGNNRGVNAA